MMLPRFARRSIIMGMAVTPLIGCSEARDTAGASSAPPTAQQSKPSAGALVEIKRDTAGLRLDLRYATINNFTGRVLYDQARAFLQGVAADALMRARDSAMNDGFGLTLFDAYRPWRVTKQLWEATPPSQRNYVANPKRGSRHNRGCAVDLSLHTLATGTLVEMPSAYDDFSERAHRDFMAAGETAIANRARLERYMEAEGFIGMSNEWWHFDHRDWQSFPILDMPFEDL
jgi:D-alanyl-D-alanine dipeptidase